MHSAPSATPFGNGHSACTVTQPPAGLLGALRPLTPTPTSIHLT
jgi:hypothetical protein